MFWRSAAPMDRLEIISTFFFVLLFVCLFVCLFVLFVCLFVCFAGFQKVERKSESAKVDMDLG
jgi:chromate transport protein ChrA